MEDSTEIRIHKTKKKFRSHVEGECFGCVKTFLEAFGLDGDDLTRKAVLFLPYFCALYSVGCQLITLH